MFGFKARRAASCTIPHDIADFVIADCRSWHQVKLAIGNRQLAMTWLTRRGSNPHLTA